MMNSTQYEFDVDVSAKVGTILATILISVEDPNSATYFGLFLYQGFEVEQFSINQAAKFQRGLDLTDIVTDFEYNNDTMLYNIPVNIILYKAFDPDDDVTTHHLQLRVYYSDGNIVSDERNDIILHAKSKLNELSITIC